VVEHDLAKVGVAGSNPVSRSSNFLFRPGSWRRSQVVRQRTAKPHQIIAGSATYGRPPFLSLSKASCSESTNPIRPSLSGDR
jgi:hypothetical protein